MSIPLIECVPNYSEARRPEVVEAILQSIQSIKGVTLLDHSSDLDHNRTVITFVGDPASVEEAAFQSIAKAAQLIDLDHHTGQHPRIGATDVVPFIPLENATMTDCIELARRLGKRVGTELNIPVYLYEDAATRPERQNLENIRRGEYEGLKVDIETHPERQPDFGPAQLGKAGATVIGARQPLIAYNIYLTTNDVTIAKEIAKVIRNSSGGLHFVKAMGVMVDGRAQVSMNLTNFHQTAIARVVEMVRREAARYGVGIHHCELIGLIPQAALIDAAAWYLQLDAFSPDQILESRLNQVAITAPARPGSIFEFLDQLAAGTATPGGGSAAAMTGASAAALVAMVARLTVGKKKYASVESQMWPLIEKAEALRKALAEAVDEDAAAFETYMQAVHLPKNTEEEQALRAAAIEKATLLTLQVPLSTAQKVVEVLALAQPAAELGNLNAISDAGTAASLALAALKGASLNVQINAQNLQDRVEAQHGLQQLKALEAQADALEASIRQIIQTRSGLYLL